MDLRIVGKYTFWGAIFLVVTFFFFHGTIGSDFVALNTIMGRNAFVYQIECVVPILLLFFYNRNLRVTFLVIFSFFFITLLTNGRAGTLIVFLYLILFLLINKVFSMKTLAVTGIFTFSIIFLGMLSLSSLTNNISSGIRPYNERLANLFIQEEDGDLEMDKSWIERKIHIIKGLEIFSIYPIKGVGLNHFVYYDTDYSTLNLSDFVVNGSTLFNAASLEELNKRSAHNSYIMILAETGIIGIALYLLFLIPIISFSLRYIFSKKLNNLDLLLFAVICISIHNWVIASYSSAISFAVFGLGYGRMIEIKSKLRL